MILDIIMLLLVAVMALAGYRKGLILSLCSLLILILSFLGACACRQLLTPIVAERAEPVVYESVSGWISDKLTLEDGDEGISVMGTDMTMEDFVAVLHVFGIEVDAQDGDTAQITGGAAGAIAEAVTDQIIGTFLGFGVFLLSFLVLYLLLYGAELMLNTMDRLPAVHRLNHAAGCIVGILCGAFLLLALTSALENAGIDTSLTLTGPLSRLLRLTESALHG